MGEGECESLLEEQPKKSRHRKKHLYNTILRQMEFYFSDSNLTKDRFLSQLLSVNPHVDIEVFFKFNKIRKLNCTKEDIQKALKRSELIGLSEDGEKIYRKQPIKVKENIDFCTIYVENIKADANHETLSQIFSDFGTVVYVSIPKYKHNKANKGFAFIEYETEEQANAAVCYFDSIGCKISSEKNPEELQSIKTFEGEQTVEPQNKDNEENKEKSKGHTKKRKLSVEEQASADGIKKKKTDIEKSVPDSEENDKTSNKQQMNTEEENKTEVTEDSKKKKKIKKDKRKNYIKELGMQVLLKKEWKKLRNHYLDLQKKKMKEFKQYLYKQKFGPKINNKPNDISEEIDEHKESDEEGKKLNFTPGVIVKLRLPEPCNDVKKFKNEVKALSPKVQYVDIPLPAGSKEVFIRFSDKEAASEFCDLEFDGEKSILSGDEEITYWEKIDNDRKVKFQKLSKKQRGRDKLLKKAEKESAKHLRFDENE